VNNNVLTNVTSGLVTKNWTYAAPVISDMEVFTVETQLKYSISGGNWYERTDTYNVVNMEYSYTVVPEPNIIALVGMGILTFFIAFKCKIQ